MKQVEYRVLGPLSPGSPSRAQLGLGVEPDGSAHPVVLIFAPEEVTSDPEAVAALEKETARATQLEHPHISRVFGLATLDQGVARVTEYADGESLRTLLDRGGAMPLTIAARLVADLAQGIHYAHMAGNDDGSPLVHGDLRPETVMVAFSGNCKVTGYGALSVAPRERDGRRVVNRRLYCAPEQVVGGRESVIVGTDVFLLGLILHECLTGRRPFSDAQDLDQAVLMGSLAKLPEALPASFQQVIERCTAKKAIGRYSSALAVREAIIEALEGKSLPSDVEIADWLQPLCPPTEIQRAARQQTIDQGIARYAREHWQKQREAPPKQVEAPAPPAPVSSPVQAVSPAAVSTPVPTAPRRPWTMGRMVGLAVVLIAAAGGGFGIWKLRAHQAAPVDDAPVAAPTSQAASTPAGTVPAAGPLPASPVVPAVAAAPLTGDLIDDAPSNEGAEAGEGNGNAVAAGEGTLSLSSSPKLTVSVGGKVVGTTPLSVPLEPGRHTVRLTSREHGISSSRTYAVRAGETTSADISFERGYLTVNAPADAEVMLNGKSLGMGTQREVGVYEGEHHLSVLVNGQKWQERFSLRANQRVAFNVGVVD